MISAVSDPREKNKAAFTVSAMAICIAAIFRVPNGNEPKKLIRRPVKKMRISFCIQPFLILIIAYVSSYVALFF
jgi:hypothetical protein